MQAQQAQAQQANQLQQAALAQQGAQFRMGLQQHAYDAASQRNLDAAQFDAQMARAPIMAEQHAQLQNWLSQQEMTAADNMRLQKLQSALSAVMGDTSLTDAEKAGFALQLKTGIDPLKARAEATRQKFEAEQTARLVKKNEMADQITQARNDFIAGNIDKLPLVTDPITGQQHRMLIDHNGQLYDPFKGARPDTSGVDVAKAENEALKQWHAAYDKARATVSGWAKEMGPKDANGLAQPRYPGLQDSEAFQHHVNQEMLNQGFDLIPAEYARKRAEQVAGRGGAAGRAPAGAGQPAGAVSPAPSPGAGPLPAAGRAAATIAPDESVAKQVPFEPGKPATADQKAVLDALDQSKADIDRSTLPPEKKQQMKHEADVLSQWLARAGRFDSPDVPPAVKALYAAHLKALDGLQYPTPPKPLTPGEKFRRGNLVTVDDVKDKLDKLNKGELVTLDDLKKLFD